MQARLLRVYLCESDKADGKPAYEAIVDRCRESGIAGATVIRGIEGYGGTAELHRGRDHPVSVLIVDSEENIMRVLPAIEQLIDVGVIAVSRIEMTRVQNEPGAEVPDVFL